MALDRSRRRTRLGETISTKLIGIDKDILPNGEGHIQNLLSVYIEMDIFNFFPIFSREKLGSDFKGIQGVNFKFAPNMSTIYSGE